MYHDNAFLKDTFDLAGLDILQRVAKHMSVYVERLWEYSQLLQRTSPDGTSRALAASSSSKHIIGQSSAMRRLLAQADKVAASEASILLLGETGVGKELLATRIHDMSPRAVGPFVVVDVTSIPESLMESELFGHEKGAFTGADRQKPGRLELANGGTVFLDEGRGDSLVHASQVPKGSTGKKPLPGLAEPKALTRIFVWWPPPTVTWKRR